MRWSACKLRGQIDQLTLGVLESHDGAGVVAHDIDHGVEGMSLRDDPAMGFGQLPFAPGAEPAFRKPQKANQASRAELRNNLQKIKFHLDSGHRDSWTFD